MDSHDRHNIRIGSAIINVCSEENKLNIFIGGQKYCDRVIFRNALRGRGCPPETQSLLSTGCSCQREYVRVEALSYLRVEGRSPL